MRKLQIYSQNGFAELHYEGKKNFILQNKKPTGFM